MGYSTYATSGFDTNICAELTTRSSTINKVHRPGKHFLPDVLCPHGNVSAADWRHYPPFHHCIIAWWW
jgi:hypothetical protein